MAKYLIILSFALMCCSSNKSTTTAGLSLDEIITENLGDRFERIDQGDKALCYTVSKEVANNRKKILVINSTTKEILYGPVQMEADVKWDSENTLLIKEYPEVIQDKNSSDTFEYRFDIISKKRIENKQ